MSNVELVELFVEEGEELIETARELLERWKDNLNSKELIADLRRIYHTIKGTSRMAGAMNIGDLGHAVEDIFNTIIDFGRKITKIDFDITQDSTDKLELMIAELKRLHWPAEAPEAIRNIRQHLNPEPIEKIVELTDVAEIENEPEIVDIPDITEIVEVSDELEILESPEENEELVENKTLETDFEKETLRYNKCQ